MVQAVLAQAKKLNKAAYIFSVDSEAGKVVHANFLPPGLRREGFDAKVWANAVTEIVLGKAGGKDDGVQGVGSEVSKVQDALVAAEQLFSKVR